MPRLLSALALLVVLATLAIAQENDTWTDPKDVPESYAVQGEYLGEVEGEKTGVHVIALGGDDYELVAYRGGLPGEGWERGDDRIRGVKGSKGDDGTITFAHDGKTIVLKTVPRQGKVPKGQPKEDLVLDFAGDGSAKRLVRRSNTLGAKPPEGAVVLFDGKNADAWKAGQVTMENLLAANTESNEKFGDHTFHLEFRTPYKPKARGQARGNSGVYLQGRYECQVLDSFGLEGENNECGGIYSIAKPAVNMCYPPLTWQTYDVDFTPAKYDDDGKKTENARVTIRHNGVVVHDDLELPNGTPGKYPEAAGPGPIYLQGHGNPVVYRNVWVVKK